MKPHVIYLVEGRTGEYEDRSEWIVCWRPTKAEADAVREQCQLHCDAWQKPSIDPSHQWFYPGQEFTSSGFSSPDDHPLGITWKQHVDAGPDPRIAIDYTGTHYVVIAVADDPHADIEET